MKGAVGAFRGGPAGRLGARYGSVGLVVGLATGLGVLANLVFNTVAARSLGPDDYGLLAALFVTAGLLGTPATGVQAITAREVALLDPAPRRRWDPWTRQLLIATGLALPVLIAGCYALAASVRATTAEVLPLLLGLPLVFLTPLLAGRLIGMSRFVVWQVSGIAGILTKMTVGLAAATLTLSVPVFVLALPLAGAVTTAIAFWFSAGPAVPRQKVLDWPLWTPTLIILGVAAVTQIDLLLARAWLTPEASGQYAAGSIITKAIALVAGMAGTLLLPTLSRQLAAGRSDTPVLAAVAAIAGAFGALCAATLTVIGPALLTAIYGPAYAQAGDLLPLLGWTSVPWCIALALINARYAQRHLLTLAGALLITVICEIALLAALRGSLTTFILGTAAIGTLLSILAFTTGRPNRTPPPPLHHRNSTDSDPLPSLSPHPPPPPTTTGSSPP